MPTEPKSSGLAPLALFMFNRPEHTAKTLLSLAQNPEARGSDLHVFSDGPRHADDAAKIQECRNFVRSLEGFKSITLHERDKNWGLAKSIISGVTEVLENSDTVIVLEDDMITSPYFLNFMNASLSTYADDSDVGCIHGYLYPLAKSISENFFLRGGDCWGWATWKRAWNLFEPDSAKLYSQLNSAGLAKDFDLGGTADYMGMLKEHVQGRNNSWAIRWHASLFLKNKFTYYPHASLVLNIGLDNSGTHCGDTDAHNVLLTAKPIAVKKQKVYEDPLTLELVKGFWRGLNPSWKKNIPYGLRKFLIGFREQLKVFHQ